MEIHTVDNEFAFYQINLPMLFKSKNAFYKTLPLGVHGVILSLGILTYNACDNLVALVGFFLPSCDFFFPVVLHWGGDCLLKY